MSWVKRTLPSSAIAVAILALVAAAAGTAVAGPGTDAEASKSTKKTAKQALKLAKKNKKAIKNIELTPGPQGPKGDTGDPGAPGATNVTVRTGPGSGEVAPGNFATDTAPCNSGEVAVGGGYSFAGDVSGTSATLDYPGVGGTTPTGWIAKAWKASGGNVSIKAYVICAAP